MSEFFANLRTLPRTYWVLIGATFVNRFGVFVWPFLTLFITSQGNSPRQAGYAVSCYSIGGLLAALSGGWLADRLGRNVTMALSSFGGATCMMIMSQCSDWRALCVVALFTGLTSEAGNPASSALIQDIVPEGKRVTAYAMQRFAINLGWSLGPATAGVLARHSYFGLFIVDAVTSVFFGIVCWLWLPRGHRTASHRAGWSVALASVRQNKPFLALCCASLLNAWVWRVTATSFPLHFQNCGLPVDWCGYVLAINGVMIIFMEMPLAALTLRRSVKFMLFTGYVLMAVSFLPLMGSPGIVAFVVSITIFTVGEMAAFSRQPAYVASLSPEDMRGRYSGVNSIAWSLGGIVSSTGTLMVYEWQHDAVWVVTAVIGLVAACIIVLGGKARPVE